MNPLDIEVERLKLPVRAYNCLKNNLIGTVGELMQFSKQDVLRMKNAGEKTLRDIEAALEEYGITLRDEKRT